MNKDYKKLTSTDPHTTNEGNKTVFSELKLSELLLQDVDSYKKIIIDKT